MSGRLPAEREAEARALLKVASALPWEAQDNCIVNEDGAVVESVDDDGVILPNDSDAALIVVAVNALPDAIAELSALRADLAAAEKARDDLRAAVAEMISEWKLDLERGSERWRSAMEGRDEAEAALAAARTALADSIDARNVVADCLTEAAETLIRVGRHLPLGGSLRFATDRSIQAAQVALGLASSAGVAADTQDDG